MLDLHAHIINMIGPLGWSWGHTSDEVQPVYEHDGLGRSRNDRARVLYCNSAQCHIWQSGVNRSVWQHPALVCSGLDAYYCTKAVCQKVWRIKGQTLQDPLLLLVLSVK